MIAVEPMDLEGHGLLTGLGGRHIQLVSTFSRWVEVEKGTNIFQEGQPAVFLYSLMRGRVGLEALVPKPHGGSAGPAMIAVLGSGESFGWSAIVEPYVMTLSAMAVEHCSLIRIEGETLRRAMQQDSELGCVVLNNLSKLLAQRLAQTRRTLLYERGWALV